MSTINQDQTTVPAGLLPAQAIEELIYSGLIEADNPVNQAQLQPASLDLRLGDVAYRTRASFLPGPSHNVVECLDSMNSHPVELKNTGTVLERGCVYLIPLQERLALPDHLVALANPKSSTGRIDVFARLIVDRSAHFDRVPQGYRGRLYLEVCPRTFAIIVRPGTRLAQLRFRCGDPYENPAAISSILQQYNIPIDRNPATSVIAAQLFVDLDGNDPSAAIGYRAKNHTDPLDLDKKDAYRTEDYWDILKGQHQTLILDPEAFYIFASKNNISVPPDLAAELTPFDPLIGEFRVHHAGFFDPGFGFDQNGTSGSRAVLEVRNYQVPFALSDGQMVANLIFERLQQTPHIVYGEAIGSHYQKQKLWLSKHFRPPETPADLDTPST